MKLLLTLLCLTVSTISSIAQDTIYYNAYWRDTTAAQATYYRTRVKSDAGWQTTDHYMNGKTQMTGLFLDDSCHIRQGEFIWLDSTGKPIHQCTYTANKEDGKETFFYTTGQINITGTNKNGQKDGKWTGYYINGKVSGEAEYANGKQTSGRF